MREKIRVLSHQMPRMRQSSSAENHQIKDFYENDDFNGFTGFNDFHCLQGIPSLQCKRVRTYTDVYRRRGTNRYELAKPVRYHYEKHKARTL